VTGPFPITAGGIRALAKSAANATQTITEGVGMGLYKRGKTWWMSYTADGRQHCESTRTPNKRLAEKILNLKVTEIIEGRFRRRFR